MDSKTYWEQREKEALNHYVTEEAEFQKRIDNIYANMLDEINGEIERFYGRYATAEGISIAEAKKRVSEADIKAYERKAKQYVDAAQADMKKHGKDYKKQPSASYYFSKQANDEMRLYNATMKINRLEMLKANIGLEMIKGHAELETFMEDILQGRTEDELKRQAGILGDTIRENAKAAHAIVNGSWQNGTFSDRIWQYQDIMRQDLGRILQTGLIQGKNPRALTKDLKKYWYGADPKTGGGAKYCMERLMRTELARVQTEAQKQSFDRMGFDEYTFHANSGCCDACQSKDGKHFKVKDMMPGENAAPMHPNCRCSCSAYEDSDEYEAWLDYLSKGGTTEDWNASAKAAWKRGEPVAPYKPHNKKLSDIKGTELYDEIAEDLEMYVGGGYGSVFDALGKNKDKFQYIKNSMTDYGKPLYRIEEAMFTLDRQNLKPGKTFSFDNDLRSFTRSKSYLDNILKPFSDVDYDEPTVFQTTGKAKHFNMDEFAQGYYENQHESLVGGTFEVVDIYEEVINRKKVKVVKIKQIKK